MPYFSLPKLTVQWYNASVEVQCLAEHFRVSFVLIGENVPVEQYSPTVVQRLPFSLHSLSENQIGDAGAAAIGEGLKLNKSLKEL